MVMIFLESPFFAAYRYFASPAVWVAVNVHVRFKEFLLKLVLVFAIVEEVKLDDEVVTCACRQPLFFENRIKYVLIDGFRRHVLQFCQCRLIYDFIEFVGVVQEFDLDVFAEVFRVVAFGIFNGVVCL